jgi:drug/metabolite transporter (DMT)-like permease
MRGLSQIGAGLFTVLYSSGPLWTAALAYVLLRRSIGGVQRAALLLVTAGLGVVALAPSAHSGGGGGGGGGGDGGGGRGGGGFDLSGGMDREFGVGLVSVLVGTALHALVYVLQASRKQCAVRSAQCAVRST